MQRTSRGRGAPLQLLWHREASRDRDRDHVPAMSPLPSSSVQLWGGMAQPGQDHSRRHRSVPPWAGGEMRSQTLGFQSRGEQTGQGDSL